MPWKQASRARQAESDCCRHRQHGHVIVTKQFEKTSSKVDTVANREQAQTAK